MDAFWALLLLVALAGALVARGVVTPTTVYEYERGVRYRDGRFAGIAEPGRHWFLGWDTKVVKVDVRPSFVSVPGQEVLSSDGVTIKIRLAAEYKVLDVAKAVNEVDSYVQALYLTLQLALRAAVGERRIEEVLEARSEIGREVLSRAKEPVARFGWSFGRSKSRM